MTIISYLEYNDAKEKQIGLVELSRTRELTEDEKCNYDKISEEIFEFEDRISNFD